MLDIFVHDKDGDNMPLAVVNTDTAEYLYSLEHGDRIVRAKHLPVFSEEDSRMAFTNGSWGKVYEDALGKLAKKNLTAAEYKAVLFLIKMVRPASGLIAYGNYRPVNMGYVEKELEFSHKTATRTIQKLMDLRIIAKNTSGGESIYFFNPYIYQKGRYINKTLYEMFKKSEWAKQQEDKR